MLNANGNWGRWIPQFLDQPEPQHADWIGTMVDGFWPPAGDHHERTAQEATGREAASLPVSFSRPLGVVSEYRDLPYALMYPSNGEEMDEDYEMEHEEETSEYEDDEDVEMDEGRETGDEETSSGEETAEEGETDDDEEMIEDGETTLVGETLHVGDTMLSGETIPVVQVNSSGYRILPLDPPIRIRANRDLGTFERVSNDVPMSADIIVFTQCLDLTGMVSNVVTS
jgi:hypothetical protein